MGETNRAGMPAGIRSFLLFFAAIALLAYSTASSADDAENLNVISYQLISKTQASEESDNGDDNYEYIYRANLANTGTSVYEASAEVHSELDEVTIIEGTVEFDLILAGETVASTNTFIIHATDSFENSLATASNPDSLLFWEIQGKTDTETPDISNQAPANNSIVTVDQPTISAQYFDDKSGMDISQIQLLLDGVDITASATVTDSGINYQPASPLTAGDHTVVLNIADRVGNSANSTWTFTVDVVVVNTAPTISLTSPADNATVTAPGSFILTADAQDVDNNIADVKFYQGTTLLATVTAAPYSYTWNNIAEGSYSITAQVTDTIGATATSAAVSVIVDPTADSTAPVIGTQQPLNNSYTSNAAPLISAQYMDVESGVNTANVHLLLDGADITSVSTITATGISHQPANLTEGVHQLALAVSDQAGNLSQALWQFTVDTLPPVLGASTPLDGATLANSNPLINAPFQDDGSGVDLNTITLTLDGNDITSNAAISTAGIDYQPAASLAQGSHAITLTVADMAGNSSQAAWSFLIDSTPSSVAITPASTPAGIAATAVVTALISDPGIIGSSVILQQLDVQGRATEIGHLHDDGLLSDTAANDQIYTLSFTIYEQNPGDLTYRTSAEIQGQLTPILSNLLNVNISGTVGTGITLTQPVDLSFVNTSPIVVAGTVSDPNATVTINGITASVIGNNFQASVPLQEGLNPLTATAVNSNGTNTTASVQATLDSAPPKVTVISPEADTSTTEPTITVTGIVNDIVVGTVNDQQANVTVNDINAQVANRTYTAPDIPLQLGANILRIVATDRTGNSATLSVTVIRTIATGTLIKLISGNNQTGPIATPLAAPLVVQAINGVTPIANVPVIFKVTQNDASLQPGAPQSSLIVVNTDASGMASTTLTLGNRAGAGNNVVEVYSTGAQGNIAFTASGTPKQPALISVDSGNNQFGAINQRLVLPMVAVVSDSGYNRLGGIPVTFLSKQGFGTFDGAATYETITDSDGRALAYLTLGSQPGQNNNIVEAHVTQNLTNGNLGYPAAFAASAKVPGDPLNTRISGVVQDNSSNPIVNVTMRLYQANLGTQNNEQTEVATPVVTDASGHFTMTGVPVGLYKLMADGNTAIAPGKQYPTLEYDIVTVAGQDNSVGMPIYLPALDPLATLCVSETTGGTLTVPSAPGFALTIQPGAATFPGGAKSGCVSVTPVNPDKMPMAPGFGQQPRYIVTIQPVGTHFNPPASLTIPNMDGLAPNAKTEMYSYDHDLAAFVAIGSATVSADGSTIASDPGIGVIKAGWHCGGNPNTTGSVGTCPTCQKCEGSGCGVDNSQTPPQNSPVDCKREACVNGGIRSLENNFETPVNFCEICLGGNPAPDVNKNGQPSGDGGCCINGEHKPKNPISDLALCPDRVPNALPQENNGCTATPWNYIAAALGIYESFDPDNPTGEVNTAFGNRGPENSLDNITPCGAHDFCYQTCLSSGGKSSCDNKFLTDLEVICGNVPASQMMSKFSPVLGTIDVSVQYACYKNAQFYFQAVNLLGSDAYDDGQKVHCDCCGN